MGIPSFFRTPKPKPFNYIPRYYDEQKEDLEERIRNIEIEMGVKEGEAYRPQIHPCYRVKILDVLTQVWLSGKLRRRIQIRLEKKSMALPENCGESSPLSNISVNLIRIFYENSRMELRDK